MKKFILSTLTMITLSALVVGCGKESGTTVASGSNKPAVLTTAGQPALAQALQSYAMRANPYYVRIVQDGTAFNQGQAAQNGQQPSVMQFDLFVKPLIADVRSAMQGINQIPTSGNGNVAQDQELLQDAAADLLGAMVDDLSGVDANNGAKIADGNALIQKSNDEFTQFQSDMQNQVASLG